MSGLLAVMGLGHSEENQTLLSANSLMLITPHGISGEEAQNLAGEYTINGEGMIRGLYLLPNQGKFLAAGKLQHN